MRLMGAAPCAFIEWGTGRERTLIGPMHSANESKLTSKLHQVWRCSEWQLAVLHSGDTAPACGTAFSSSSPREYMLAISARCTGFPTPSKGHPAHALT